MIYIVIYNVCDWPLRKGSVWRIRKKKKTTLVGRWIMIPNWLANERTGTVFSARYSCYRFGLGIAVGSPECVACWISSSGLVHTVLKGSLDVAL